MTPDDVREFYTNGYKFNLVTGMSASTLANWFQWGYVPYLAQKKLEFLSDGKLTAEFSADELLRKKPRRLREKPKKRRTLQEYLRASINRGLGHPEND